MAKLRYVSLFSGIEAVSCALDHDVWEPVAFSEIDPDGLRLFRVKFNDAGEMYGLTQINEAS